MNHASLFSGIGGFDLAAQWCGWRNVLQCETDPFCQKILRHHFPKTHLHGNVKTLDGAKWRGKIDVLTGGFPCQPFSVAGRRRGTTDDRFLWPAMFRFVAACAPEWVVAENVYGLVSIENGMVFGQVLDDLESADYECQPFVIPACGVSAPHLRYRLWIVAHRRSGRFKRSRLVQPGRSPIDANRQETDWPEAATRLLRVADGIPPGLDVSAFSRVGQRHIPVRTSPRTRRN